MNTSFLRLKCQWNIKMIFYILLFLTLTISTPAFAEQQQMNAGDSVADRAKATWMDGATSRALDILDQGIRDDPHDLKLQKLRGDILATSRRNQEAVQAYEAVLQSTPEALDVRWAKWSVLIRSGKGDEAII